jgi:hypothetical protein
MQCVDRVITELREVIHAEGWTLLGIVELRNGFTRVEAGREVASGRPARSRATSAVTLRSRRSVAARAFLRWLQSELLGELVEGIAMRLAEGAVLVRKEVRVLDGLLAIEALCIKRQIENRNLATS